MKPATEWNQAIINITMKIQEEFPELSKYIKEMPIRTLEEDSNVNDITNLKEYYNSLKEMLQAYSKTHKNENSI